MPKFYGTFRQADHARKNMFVVIEAENRKAATEKMYELFGDDWSMMYGETEFAGQPEKYGLTELKIS